MNNKVYIVKELWACDYESGNSVVAFSTLDKAKKYFQSRVEDTKANYDYDTIEELDMNYSFYNEGYYITNHTDIEIEELEIDKKLCSTKEHISHHS